MKDASRRARARSTSCAAPAAERMLVAIVIDEFRLLAANLFLGSEFEINDRRISRGSKDRNTLPHRDQLQAAVEWEAI